jgi:hypothetical protein
LVAKTNALLTVAAYKCMLETKTPSDLLLTFGFCVFRLSATVYSMIGQPQADVGVHSDLYKLCSTFQVLEDATLANRYVWLARG